MTHFNENPGSVRVDRFRLSGKWYDTYAIDMSKYYGALLIHEAVCEAWLDRYDWGEGTGLTNFLLICLDPYHVNSYPVMINSDFAERVLRRRNERSE